MSSTEIDLPHRMRGLPLDKHGRPVPWFVGYFDGEPDFRVVRENGLTDALRFKICWLCGAPLGKFVTFVIGPMCAVNRVSAEPGCHRECATYAAMACPFLANPTMQRRERGKPAHTDPAGVMILRNPGVALVWTSRTWSPFRVGTGLLFDVGDPVETAWYAQGRPATRAEVLAAIDSGLPLLRSEAERSGDPAAALAHIEQQLERALELIPGESA